MASNKAYLAVMSYLDELVQPSYMLSTQIKSIDSVAIPSISSVLVLHAVILCGKPIPLQKSTGIQTDSKQASK